MLLRSATRLILFSTLTFGLMAQGLDNFSQKKTDWEEINFEFNSSVLVDGYPSLLRLAELLGKHPDYKVRLIGNADRIGNNRVNDKLGQRRADTVKSFLVKYGANAGQITTETRGKRSPESSSPSKEGRFVNRRVNVLVTDAQGNTISDGSVGDAINAMGEFKKCCDDILARLDKLDDILKKLDAFVAENAGLKRDLAGLQDRVNKLQGDVTNVGAEVQKRPDEQKVTNIVDTETMKQIRSSRDPRFSLLGLNAGVDDNRQLTFNARGRYFAPTGKLFGENFAIQAQGEYMYYRDRREGQFDIGLVNRIGNAQLGGFGSFKHVSLRGMQNGATLGQFAGTFDYLFSRGKVGIFGTKGFMDGGVVNRVQNTQFLATETYLGIVDQYGVSTTLGLIRDVYLEGNIGYLRSKAGSDRPGGTLKLVLPVKDRFAFTLAGDLNPTYLRGYQSTQITAGFEVGNFLRPRDFVGMTGPVPVDVPRIRFETLTRQVRTGYSPPVAIVGPDQIGVPAGPITLDASGSYSPEGLALTYAWRQIAGPGVSLSGANTARATFTAEAGQTYGFVVTVTDTRGGQATARTTVTTTNPQRPQIVRFAANPPLIQSGQSSVISYQVLNADTVEIQGPGGGSVNAQAGTLTVSPTTTTNYRLVARNALGEVSDTLTITVQGAAVTIGSFAANPSTINSGQSSTLTWTTQNATSVTISGLGTVEPNGSRQVSPTTTTSYVLTATNGSSSVSQVATVTVNGTGGNTGNPIVTSFAANPTQITQAGQCSTLTWVVNNATSVSITSLGTVASSGNSSVCPTQTTTYTLTATNGSGTTTAQVTVNVNIPNNPPPQAAPTITATASPNPSPSAGTPVTITYSTTNANRVVVIGVSQGILPAQGTVTVRPQTTTSYTLVAYNDTTNQTATATVNVTVGTGGGGPTGPAPTVRIVGAPVIVTVIRDVVLDASGSTDSNGGPLTFRWVSLDNKGAVLDPTSPRPRVQVSALYGDYLFQVTVTNAQGVSATGVVTVRLNTTTENR